MAAPKQVKAKTAGRPDPQDAEERIKDDRNVLRTRSGRPINLDLANPEEQFAFDRSIIPDGWDYEWKTLTVANAPWTQHQVNMAQAGWEPVPAERHDGLFLPRGVKGNIERGGMILMERPIQATQISRARDKAKADAQVNAAFARAGQSVPTNITDFNHDGARRVSGVKVDRTNFATQSEESYAYSLDE